jgi:hypothetical protein
MIESGKIAVVRNTQFQNENSLTIVRLLHSDKLKLTIDLFNGPIMVPFVETLIQAIT